MCIQERMKERSRRRREAQMEFGRVGCEREVTTDYPYVHRNPGVSLPIDGSMSSHRFSSGNRSITIYRDIATQPRPLLQQCYCGLERQFIGKEAGPQATSVGITAFRF